MKPNTITPTSANDEVFAPAISDEEIAEWNDSPFARRLLAVYGDDVDDDLKRNHVLAPEVEDMLERFARTVENYCAYRSNGGIEIFVTAHGQRRLTLGYAPSGTPGEPMCETEISTGVYMGDKDYRDVIDSIAITAHAVATSSPARRKLMEKAYFNAVLARMTEISSWSYEENLEFHKSGRPILPNLADIDGGKWLRR